MNNFLNKFKGKPNSKELGFLAIQERYLDFDKQKHGALALFCSLLAFPLALIWLKQNDIISALVGGLFVWFVGYVIEIVQLFRPNRTFSHIDAFTMFLFGLLGCLLFAFSRIFLNH